ncbi:7966_t:CDS:1, partial [Dentiscutata heterogama]
MAFQNFNKFNNAVSDKHINYFAREDFSEIEKITEGGFSSVYKAKWQDYGLSIVIKHFRIIKSSDERIIKE